MNPQSLPGAVTQVQPKARTRKVVLTSARFDELVAFAEKRGLMDKPHHLVVEEFRKASLH